MIELIGRSKMKITVKTAAEISAKVTIGLFSPITSQIDPVKSGEVMRAVKISSSYGMKLIDSKIVDRFTYGYPSHSYVIDIDEAKEIFKNVRPVRELDVNEKLLEEFLFGIVREQINKELIDTIYPNQNIESKGDGNGKHSENGSSGEPSEGIPEKKKSGSNGSNKKLS